MTEFQPIELHKTRDFSKKLNATIEFLKQNFKPLFKCLFYIAGPFVILGSLLMTQAFSGMFRTMMNTSSGIDPTADMITNMASFGVLAYLFLLIGGTAVIATVNEYISLYENKKSNKIEVSEIWQRVKKSFWMVLGTMILYVVILVAGYMVILIPVVLLSMASPALMFIFVLGVGVALTYIAVTFSLIFIVRTYERVGFGEAVSRCFKLVKGKWWSTFGIILVTSLIQSVVSSIFFIPWYANFIIEMLHNVDTNAFEEPSLLFQIINNVAMLLYMISSYILYCIPLIAIAFQYFNLVEMKEARGLMSKIESFGTEQPAEDDEEHY